MEPRSSRKAGEKILRVILVIQLSLLQIAGLFTSNGFAIEPQSPWTTTDLNGMQPTKPLTAPEDQGSVPSPVIPEDHPSSISPANDNPLSDATPDASIDSERQKFMDDMSAKYGADVRFEDVEVSGDSVDLNGKVSDGESVVASWPPQLNVQKPDGSAEVWQVVSDQPTVSSDSTSSDSNLNVTNDNVIIGGSTAGDGYLSKQHLDESINPQVDQATKDSQLTTPDSLESPILNSDELQILHQQLGQVIQYIGLDQNSPDGSTNYNEFGISFQGIHEGDVTLTFLINHNSCNSYMCLHSFVQPYTATVTVHVREGVEQFAKPVLTLTNQTNYELTVGVNEGFSVIVPRTDGIGSSAYLTSAEEKPLIHENSMSAVTISSAIVDANTASISWTAVEGAVIYQVQISTDPNFQDPNQIREGFPQGTSENFSDLGYGTYYARVRASSDMQIETGQVGPWSEVVSFENKAIQEDRQVEAEAWRQSIIHQYGDGVIFVNVAYDLNGQAIAYPAFLMAVHEVGRFFLNWNENGSNWIHAFVNDLSETHSGEDPSSDPQTEVVFDPGYTEEVIPDEFADPEHETPTSDKVNRSSENTSVENADIEVPAGDSDRLMAEPTLKQMNEEHKNPDSEKTLIQNTDVENKGDDATQIMADPLPDEMKNENLKKESIETKHKMTLAILKANSAFRGSIPSGISSSNSNASDNSTAEVKEKERKRKLWFLRRHAA